MASWSSSDPRLDLSKLDIKQKVVVLLTIINIWVFRPVNQAKILIIKQDTKKKHANLFFQPNKNWEKLPTIFFQTKMSLI